MKKKIFTLFAILSMVCTCQMLAGTHTSSKSFKNFAQFDARSIFSYNIVSGGKIALSISTVDDGIMSGKDENGIFIATDDEATITVSASGCTITKIEYTFADDLTPSDNGYDEDNSTEGLVVSESVCEFNGSATSVVMKFSNIAALGLTGIKVTYVDGFVLNDGDEYSNTSNKTTDVTYTRTYNGKWQPLYVPFSLDIASLAGDYEFGQINGVREQDTNGDGVIDYEVMDVIKLTTGSTKANFPYFIKAKDITEPEKTIELSGVALKAAATTSIDCSTTSTLYTITGTYTAKDADFMDGKYAMGGGSLIIGDGEYGLGAQRWYMTSQSRNGSGSYNAAKLIISFDGEDEVGLTGIENINTNSSKETICYNVAAQRVSADTKGLIIKNGKKYFNK